MPTAPIVPQGTLNRVRASVVVTNTPSLNITSSYMGQSFVSVSFQGDFAQLIGTGTGGVTSPEPYVMATVTVSILRTQSLGNAWFSQTQANSAIGPITVYSDTSAFQAIPLDNCVIRGFDPGAFDGKDPVSRLTLEGIFYINSSLWALT